MWSWEFRRSKKLIYWIDIKHTVTFSFPQIRWWWWRIVVWQVKVNNSFFCSYFHLAVWMYACCTDIYVYQVISSKLCLVPHEMFAFYVTDRVLQCSFRFYNWNWSNKKWGFFPHQTRQFVINIGIFILPMPLKISLSGSIFNP